jgi:hypothetical protein
LSLLRHISAAVIAIVIAHLIGSSAYAQSAAPLIVQIRRIGSVGLNMAANSSAAGLSKSESALANGAPWTTIVHEGYVNRRIPVNNSLPSKTVAEGAVGRGTTAGLKIPQAASIPFATTNTFTFAGFEGVGEFDSDDANPTIRGVEPPDQGMCVGNGKVIDIVNLVMEIYDTSGSRLAGPIALNSFFGVPDFISDPRCYYDSNTDTFIFTITDLDMVNESFSNLLVAVLPGSLSGGVVYNIDTTDTKSHCPCFEDQPLLGVDANGVYISGNEFPINPSDNTFYGAQIYAIDKADLLSESSTVDLLVFQNPLLLSGQTAASVQPAVTSPGQFANNTEFFLSSLDFTFTLDNRIAVWAMTNTCAIPSFSGPPLCGGLPSLLAPAVLNSRTYGVPVNASQKGGPHPLGQLVKNRLEELQTDDDRMQQVVLMNGTLYSALTTTLKVGGVIQAGILYFFVQPSAVAGTVNGTITASGYVAHSGANLFYPSIGVTPDNSAAMVFSLSGRSNFPSVAYVPLSNDLGTLQIYFAQVGVSSYDGASGYPAFGGNGVARWGDYSAAFTDGTNIWVTGEYVSGSCVLKQYKSDYTCGGTRGEFANWGTFIGEITP